MSIRLKPRKGTSVILEWNFDLLCFIRKIACSHVYVISNTFSKFRAFLTGRTKMLVRQSKLPASNTQKSTHIAVKIIQSAIYPKHYYFATALYTTSLMLQVASSTFVDCTQLAQLQP
jgi:hypothetical protein